VGAQATAAQASVAGAPSHAASVNMALVASSTFLAGCDKLKIQSRRTIRRGANTKSAAVVAGARPARREHTPASAPADVSRRDGLAGGAALAFTLLAGPAAGPLPSTVCRIFLSSTVFDSIHSRRGRTEPCWHAERPVVDAKPVYHHLVVLLVLLALLIIPILLPLL